MFDAIDGEGIWLQLISKGVSADLLYQHEKRIGNPISLKRKKKAENNSLNWGKKEVKDLDILGNN
jgi:hypothetical protein